MKTIPTDSIKPDAPSILLLLGLSTSLLSVGMGTLVPSFIQGGTLMLVAAGVIWSPPNLLGRNEIDRWRTGRFYWSLRDTPVEFNRPADQPGDAASTSRSPSSSPLHDEWFWTCRHGHRLPDDGPTHRTRWHCAVHIHKRISPHAIRERGSDSLQPAACQRRLDAADTYSDRMHGHHESSRVRLWHRIHHRAAGGIHGDDLLESPCVDDHHRHRTCSLERPPRSLGRCGVIIAMLLVAMDVADVKSTLWRNRCA